MTSIILKNSILKQWGRVTNEVKEYVKSVIMIEISNSEAKIREMCCGIMSAILKFEKLTSWPGLIEYLVNATNSDNIDLAYGAFSALEMICDEHMTHLVEDKSIYILVPSLIETMKHFNETFRYYSLKCMVHLISWKPKAVSDNMNQFIDALVYVAQYDETRNVRNQVCHCFIQMVESDIQELAPYIQEVVNYMLIMCNSDDPTIALTASDFWKFVAEYKPANEAILNCLHPILETLLSGMKMSKEEILNFELDDTNDEEEMNPNQKKGEKWNIEEECDDIIDGPSDWSIRKASAKGLDALSYLFPSEILPILLPLLDKYLNSQDWLEREAAILAIGAISRGCGENLYEYLPHIIPFLFQLLNDENAAIRSMTCWSLSKCSNWLVNTEEGNKNVNQFISAMLDKVGDVSNSTQESAFAALSYFVESAKENIVPYIKSILTKCMEVYPRLTARTAIVFYDNIITLTEVVGREIGKDEYLNIYIGPLFERWKLLNNEDIRLKYLMECLTAISASIGKKFVPYVEVVLHRCVKIINDYLMNLNLHKNEPLKYDPPEESLMVASIDLISGMCEGLHSAMYDYLKNYNIGEMLVIACQDESTNILKSLFGLIGDLSKCAYTLIEAVVPQLLPLIINQIKPRVLHVNVANNATWAFGELCLHNNPAIHQFAEQAKNNLLIIMEDPFLHSHLYENSIISLGRLGLTCPPALVEDLENYFTLFCRSLSVLEDDLEKDSAFKGLYTLIKANPIPAFKDFSTLCQAIASWKEPRSELKQMTAELLLAFKSSFREEWSTIFSLLPIDVQNSLVHTFNVGS